MEYDFSWMKEKNLPDGSYRVDGEYLEPREIEAKAISTMTQYVDDANRYYMSKVENDGPDVWLWWSYCRSLDSEINPRLSHFMVWGTNLKTFGKHDVMPKKALFVFAGYDTMFRDMCTKETLDEWEKKITGME